MKNSRPQIVFLSSGIYTVYQIRYWMSQKPYGNILSTFMSIFVLLLSLFQDENNGKFQIPNQSQTWKPNIPDLIGISFGAVIPLWILSHIQHQWNDRKIIPS